MYRVVSLYKDSCAIINKITGELEAIESSKVGILLCFGLQIEGVSLDSNGRVVFSDNIPVLNSLEDTEEADDEDDDDAYDFDIYSDEDVDEDDIEVDDNEEEEEDYLDIYDDDDDMYYGTQEQSTVSKLYEFLNEEQIKLLKRYYLWYSQRLFTNAQKDPTLGMKDKNRLKIKQANLSVLRNQGGMWHYAGFVDTGYDGGGYCTLGHKLRYMHLAWDVSVSDIETTFFGDQYTNDFEDLIESNNCIIFGLKCISDFFEVNSDCTKALQKAQRESLKDMELMYQQYLDGTAQEVSNSLGVADEVYKRYRYVEGRNAIIADNEGILSNGFLQFYFQFRESGMPVPKSLIQEMRDKIVGWTSHKFYGSISHPQDVFITNISNLIGKNFRVFSNKLRYIDSAYHTGTYYDYVYRYLTMYFCYEICGYFKYDAKVNKDEGGSSERVWQELRSLYRYTQRRFFADFEFSLAYINKLCDLEKLICSAEEEFSSISYSDVKPLGEEVSHLYSVLQNIKNRYGLQYGISGNTNLTIDTVMQDVSDTITKFRDSYKTALENQDTDIEKEQENAPVSEKEAYDWLLNNDVSNVAGEDFAKKVLDTCKKYNKEPSSKQMYYLKSLYEKATGKKVVKAGEHAGGYILEDNSDYMKAVIWKVNQGGTDFETKLCNTVLKSKKYSDKQKHYLDNVFVQFKQAGN